MNDKTMTTILALFNTGAVYTAHDVAYRLNLTERTVKPYLKKAKETGRLRDVGARSYRGQRGYEVMYQAPYPKSGWVDAVLITRFGETLAATRQTVMLSGFSWWGPLVVDPTEFAKYPEHWFSLAREEYRRLDHQAKG